MVARRPLSHRLAAAPPPRRPLPSEVSPGLAREPGSPVRGCVVVSHFIGAPPVRTGPLPYGLALRTWTRVVSLIPHLRVELFDGPDLIRCHQPAPRKPLT